MNAPVERARAFRPRRRAVDAEQVPWTMGDFRRAMTSTQTPSFVPLTRSSAYFDGRAIRMCSAMYEGESRTALLDLPIGLIEDVSREGAATGDGPEGFSPDFQVCMPYRGLFVWHVGGDDIVGDPNQLLFVKGGESFRVSRPVPCGFAELIITPDREVLSEIACSRSEALAGHPLFQVRTCRADAFIQTLRAQLFHLATQPHVDALEAEELVLDLLRSALQPRGRKVWCGPKTKRLIRSTKELLQARFSDRLLLADVAQEVGASPAYLTDVFRRMEGVPLHQYLLQLRLAHALVELPRNDDLTSLALDLGFSSHSHFSYAFRRAFGCTPSAFRDDPRTVRCQPTMELSAPHR